jgi:glutamine amidotransferase
MVSIIDYGVGNLGSLVNIHKRSGLDVEIANSISHIERSTHLILPGVGSFDAAIKKLDESGLREALERAVMERKTPVLGICLGMQMMTEGSEEGSLQGLGWIKGSAQRFKLSAKLKVPHVGWNTVSSVRQNGLFDKGLPQRYYFVHSFFVSCNEQNDIIGQTDYGINFTSAYHRENIYGVQFHPEKSHNFGKQLLSNFSDI